MPAITRHRFIKIKIYNLAWKGFLWFFLLWLFVDILLYNKFSFSKLRIPCSDVYLKILHVSRRSSASEMFVTNNIPNIEALSLIVYFSIKGFYHAMLLLTVLVTVCF